MNKCGDCGWELLFDGQDCPNCAQFVRLKNAQGEFVKRRRRMNKRPGNHFAEQSRRYAAELAKGRELPLSGQDAALPPGDR